MPLRLPRRLSRRALALSILAACIPLSLSAAEPAAEKPQRIVSLNLCTDQLLMMLVDPDRIAAISYLSRNEDTSVMARQARELPLAHGFAEEILTLKSDLVLAGTFTTRPTVALLKRLGHTVLVVPPAYSLDDIRKNVRLIAAAVGEEEKGEALIDAFDDRLKRLTRPPSDPKFTAVTYYANNYTSGSNTLADEVIRMAGFRNLAADKGTRGVGRLSLEALIAQKPDVVLLGRTRANYNTVTADNLRHPALKVFLQDVSHVNVPDNLWICGTPHTLDAIERLAQARRKLLTKTRQP